MRIANPLFLYLALLAIPLFAGLLVLLGRHRKAVANRFVERGLESQVARAFDIRRYRLKNILLCVTVFFSFLALSRPQLGFSWEKISRYGLDILIAIDTSRSMLTEDVRPNRLERSKLAVRDLLGKLKGDRVGLIAFSGDAFMVSPLTVDYGGFLLSLDSLNTDTIPRGGTNIGRVIEETLKSYQDVPARYKALIILTDGDNLEGNPLSWAETAAEKKVKIYTVGVGTRDGELIRVRNEKGEQEFLKDKDGNIVKSRLNEKLLNEIAAKTGGTYVRSSGAESGLDYLYDVELSRLERRDIESDVEKKYTDRFQWLLLIAVIGLIVESAVTTRRQGVSEE